MNIPEGKPKKTNAPLCCLNIGGFKQSTINMIWCLLVNYYSKEPSFTNRQKVRKIFHLQALSSFWAIYYKSFPWFFRPFPKHLGVTGWPEVAINWHPLHDLILPRISPGFGKTRFGALPWFYRLRRVWRTRANSGSCLMTSSMSWRRPRLLPGNPRIWSKVKLAKKLKRSVHWKDNWLTCMTGILRGDVDGRRSCTS